MTTKRLTPKQVEALRMAVADDGHLRSIQGGWWTTSAGIAEHAAGGTPILSTWKSWTTQTHTVYALERRQLVERLQDDPRYWRATRRVTDAGRAALAEAEDKP